jgi:RNA polymerase sigma-70 factor (ECF subfamily)
MARKRRFTSFFTGSHDDDEEFFNLASDAQTPQQKLESQEFEQKFKEILMRLPEKQRETFVLRYYEEMPYKEISTMLGTTVGGLKANYYQAVKKLADYLGNELEKN